MGLDDLVKERAYEVGEVNVDRPRTMNLTDEWWRTMAAHFPHMLFYDAQHFTDKQIKWYISLLDEVIQDEMYGMSSSDSQIDEARRARERLLEYL